VADIKKISCFSIRKFELAIKSICPVPVTTETLNKKMKWIIEIIIEM